MCIYYFYLKGVQRYVFWGKRVKRQMGKKGQWGKRLNSPGLRFIRRGWGKWIIFNMNFVYEKAIGLHHFVVGTILPGAELSMPPSRGETFLYQ